ncbi:hypothetical protein DF182_30705 [Chitinophaga flava]|uniref:Uncharacterized protein n=2 Tax=Chitinophaga flava TaxID=2259036 RepID=A0A365XX61_9BACT|nr:hypothetical protein DF182_30705 [Chitinophaga flava]
MIISWLSDLPAAFIFKLLSWKNHLVMIHVTLSYKNREFFQFEDTFLAQIAENTKKLLYALLEDIYDLLALENGHFRINLDNHPKIEVEGFSTDLRNQIERTLRGEYDYEY